MNIAHFQLNKRLYENASATCGGVADVKHLKNRNPVSTG